MAACAAVGVAVVSGCGSTVEAVPADRASDPLCVQVAAAWPQSVAKQERVANTADDQGVAAWGDPAIIARCGATSPGPTTDDCVAADGIDWVGRRVEGGMVFVSYGRAPAVEVLVPRQYAPEPLLLGAFAHATGAIPQGPHQCR